MIRRLRPRSLLPGRRPTPASPPTCLLLIDPQSAFTTGEWARAYGDAAETAPIRAAFARCADVLTARRRHALRVVERRVHGSDGGGGGGRRRPRGWWHRRRGGPQPPSLRGGVPGGRVLPVLTTRVPYPSPDFEPDAALASLLAEAGAPFALKPTTDATHGGNGFDAMLRAAVRAARGGGGASGARGGASWPLGAGDRDGGGGARDGGGRFSRSEFAGARLVIGGCTTTSCVRVSSQAIKRAVFPRLSSG